MLTLDTHDGLDVFLVGGAVRDGLMGLPVRDRDWVVTGATPEDMVAQGFKIVGQQFPVFLHPETHEEYALARTERKTGPGYKGFEFNTGADISIEDDLRRRDLTINAIAQSMDGTLIDPYGGTADIRNKLLRHVSPAFAEDPVRVLRVARFKARFQFEIAAETLTLMRSLVESGEVDHLVAERTWGEVRSALSESKPSIFFEALRECGALARVLPEIDALFGVPQRPEYHPEIDAGIHTMMVIDMAASMTADLPTRFAALVHDLGKAMTPKEQWPRHPGHEHSGLPRIRELCERLRVPHDIRDLALVVCKIHLNIHRAFELKAGTVLDLLQTIDAFHRPQRLEQVLIAVEADKRGRAGLQHEPYPQADYLRACFRTAREINAGSVRGAVDGPEIGARIRAGRIEAISAVPYSD